MKKMILCCTFTLLSLLMYGQTLALKTNGLQWAGVSPNASVEMGIARQWTINVSGTYNPWLLGGEKKLQIWAIQPELRYWLCESFEGHFLGVHAHGGAFQTNGLALPSFIIGANSDHFRYNGYFLGAGLSYGYQWILTKRWGLEATLGFGYAYVKYDKYIYQKCEAYLGEFRKSPGYFGPTKAGLSIIYFIK